MKRLVILLMLALSFSVYAQKKAPPADSSVNCITNWQKEETQTYSIVHEKKTLQPNQDNKLSRYRYEAKVWVVDASDTDYTIRWVFDLPRKTSEATPDKLDSLPFYDGMQMVFRISNTGSFIELVNWEEVSNNYGASHIFKTKEAVESALIREIQLFHLPYGYKYSTAKVGANTQLSNPFGGNPLPAVQTYQVTKIDPQQDQYTLVLRQYIDKANIDKWLEPYIKKMRIPDEKQRQVLRQQLTSLQLTDHSEYRFIRSSGWIKHLSYERKAVANGYTQSDSYTIDMIADTPR
jgi:hypothetical protein